MEFPCLVYKVPGPHGFGYTYRGCDSPAQWEELKAQGWFPDRDSARAGELAEEAVEAAEEMAEAVEEITGAARDELERQAKELGVKFNHRTRDEVLVQRIAEATD